MFHSLWNSFLYRPLLNALAVLIAVIPGGDIGLAVVILTAIVKILLFPLSQGSIKNQAAMSKLAPELEQIKKSGASKEEQARLTFELYQRNKTNPFSGCLLVLIQIPIIFALYFTFYKGVSFDGNILYSFVKNPTPMNNLFLGLIDVGSKSLFLAVIAGISQYFQAYFMPKPANSIENDTESFSTSFTRSLNMQMKYVFPIIMGFISYRSGVVALYFITSNVFAIGQQLYVNSKQK